MSLTAVITAKGDSMTTEIAALEETAARQATVAGEQPKPTKKARVARQGAHVAPAKAQSGKKAPTAKKRRPRATRTPDRQRWQ